MCIFLYFIPVGSYKSSSSVGFFGRYAFKKFECRRLASFSRSLSAWSSRPLSMNSNFVVLSLSSDRILVP